MPSIDGTGIVVSAIDSGMNGGAGKDLGYQILFSEEPEHGPGQRHLDKGHSGLTRISRNAGLFPSIRCVSGQR